MKDLSTPVHAYLTKIQQELSTGHAQEHSYRPALKELFEAITGLRVVNEPKGSEHGRPDFIFDNAKIPVAWAECKDLHVNLDKVEKSEQMARYFGYPKLILTNGLEFRFYKNGLRYGEPIVVASRSGTMIETKPGYFDLLTRTMADVVAEPSDTIRSAEHLAKIMGGKGRRLRDNIIEMFDKNYVGNTEEIRKIYGVLKDHLIHDLTEEQFADLYAQTLVYGLFVARYHDDSAESFSRAEAREHIPASNHLLQQFFDHIAGANFEKRLSFIVDELCNVFRHADVHALVHGLYRQMSMEGETHDPIIHFYEDFLREYDPKLRMDRGVFYTPLPVVRYIVRSVDALLKEHFDLREGLADRAAIEWSFTEQGKKSKRPIARVQILDPAVGTGTFLNEVIRTVHERFKGQEGSWPAYVNDHLISRLHGFELMMASYTIAHLKLGMTFAETGVKDVRKRLRVFLTNSLEEASPHDDTLFASLGLQGALTEEAQLAHEVKRDYPIMVVLGNPPYSVSSQNASTEIGPDGKKRKTWIGKLLDDYKRDLNEKKLNLDDDYIKFIRFSHHLIEKNGQGIVAMITNNSYFDGITHRRMRESLLQTFDHIHILDIHGNSKRKEKAPDGSKDENVFDIMQGVGIALFVKTGKKKEDALGSVHHYELYGKRMEKYDWLAKHDITNTAWKELEAPEPNFFFVPKDLVLQSEYEKNTKLCDLFPSYGSGVKTERDRVSIHWTEQSVREAVHDFRTLSINELRTKYDLKKDSRDWTVKGAIDDVKSHDDPSLFRPILYRPFDIRHTWYSGQTRGFIGTPGFQTMQQLTHPNLALITSRTVYGPSDWQDIQVTNKIVEFGIMATRVGNSAPVLPLYLFGSETNGDNECTTNLNMELLHPVLSKLRLRWLESSRESTDNCGPEDIFDFVYAILHCPTYRKRYKEFLKIDFPRIPFTSKKALFWELVALGREIRQLHLFESPALRKLITTFPITGDNGVEKITFDKGKVWINGAQYFGNVPKDAWEFPIGGYQPAQKWLKDRKGRMLTSDDILHYQKIIVALVETARLMKEIDGVIEKHGGFPIS